MGANAGIIILIIVGLVFVGIMVLALVGVFKDERIGLVKDKPGRKKRRSTTPTQRRVSRSRKRDKDKPLPADATVTFAAERKAADIDEVFEALDNDLVGLVPVKKKVQEIAALLLVDRARMDKFFTSNPGMSSRIAHHLNFAAYELNELTAIGRLMLEQSRYYLSEDAEKASRPIPHRPDGPASVRQRPQRPQRARARPAPARPPSCVRPAPQLDPR
jgi:hypothetical protein